MRKPSPAISKKVDEPEGFDAVLGLLVLFLTIVGIPLSLAGGVGFLLVLWVASIYGALVLGTWVLSVADYDNRWVALFAGLFILTLLDFVPLGGVLEFAVLLVGLGAFALALRGESGDDGVGAADEGSHRFEAEAHDFSRGRKPTTGLSVFQLK